MPKKVYSVKLKKKEHEYLEDFVKQGKKSAREINRARILLLANDQKLDKEIVEILKVARGTTTNVRKRYVEEGLQSALKEKPRSGAPSKIDSRVEASITMIACSDPPSGCNRWTLRLIADKAVELKIIDNISYVTVENILKKTS